MRKKAYLPVLAAAAFTLALAGCGRGKADNSNDNQTGMASTENTVDSTGTESGTSQLQLGSAVEIPESFDGQLAETDAHERLERVIAAYCNVPEEEYEHVRYYYNYVDLNGDSEDEILALVLGQDVDGIQGNILLWLDEDDDEYDADAVEQAFKHVGTPIYISNHMTGGYRDLIIPENTNIVAGTDGSGMDTVGGGIGNELEISTEMAEKGVTGVDITEEGAGSGTTGNGSGVERSTDSEMGAAGTGTAGSGSGAAGTGTAGSGTDEVRTDTAETGSDADTGIVPISLDQQYRLLVWNGERYQRIEEGTALFSLEGYEGIAVLTNNIESDLVNDNYHFLGEAMR